MIKQGTKLTAEQVQQMRNGKANFDKLIQSGLAEILTTEWQEYGEIHRAINAYLSQRMPRKQDLEFITLNASLRLFAKSTPLDWKTEKTGQYASQRKSFVRIKN